ncbi:hypothetical protein J5069_03530 [Candidatus Symbiopectobacterium sp. NZEC127]|uniref:hypothetical protein n=1 Tax=Candidatus Symbiopectobacterium sp. NZEC127 TaxID=2820472 RepID=UPI002225C85B|nr:hypothetical protein [Candidatus Symbiopectobacterium sp. NZEC127]MCW2484962.1 hypothetical protein [Candidatus Symbiopectobacterium sp. NZEC127]
MKAKIGFFGGFALLYSSLSNAAGGDFIFRVNNEEHRFPARCVDSLKYQDKDEMYPERVSMRLTTECGKTYSELTTKNVGKQLAACYESNLLMSALIISRMGPNIMLTTDKTPRVVLMQLLTDYGVKPN